jgi:hypothetical protein
MRLTSRVNLIKLLGVNLPALLKKLDHSINVNNIAHNII